jgi:hypothetical protein
MREEEKMTQQESIVEMRFSTSNHQPCSDDLESPQVENLSGQNLFACYVMSIVFVITVIGFLTLKYQSIRGSSQAGV